MNNEDNQNNSISEEAVQYLVSEQTVIGARITWYLEKLEKMEVYALVASFAYWGSILSHDFHSLTYFLAFIPILLTEFYRGKIKLYNTSIVNAFDYLYIIENKMNVPSNVGWVHYYKSKNINSKKVWRDKFWKYVFRANLAIAILLLLHTMQKDFQIFNKIFNILKAYTS